MSSVQPVTSSIFVTVYSGPGCMSCQITKSQFAKAGIPFVERAVLDHPHITERVDELKLKRQLPVVEVVNSDGEDMFWSGLDRENINALKYLFSEEQ